MYSTVTLPPYLLAFLSFLTGVVLLKCTSSCTEWGVEGAGAWHPWCKRLSFVYSSHHWKVKSSNTLKGTETLWTQAHSTELAALFKQSVIKSCVTTWTRSWVDLNQEQGLKGTPFKINFIRNIVVCVYCLQDYRDLAFSAGFVLVITPSFLSMAS